jgi:voltage-gated potassium channel Kch
VEPDHLSDHTIVCGYGRVGRRAVEEFRPAVAPYVVEHVFEPREALAT